MAQATGSPTVKNRHFRPFADLRHYRNVHELAVLSVLAVCLFSLPSRAQDASAPATPTATEDTTASRPPAIDIGPGDLLDIVVFDTPELSGHVRVTQDGFANLPVLGRIDMNGLTADQAAKRLEEELRSRNLLVEPHVTVFIVEYASQGATITGEIRQPGIYPTLGKRRLLDMIAIAGGLSPTAGKAVAIIRRDDPTHPLTIPLQANAHLGDQENPQIHPGDTIIVGKAGVVYILGDVGKPGGFLVDNNDRLSTAQALSLAGGPNKTASLSKTRLIRKVEGGHEEFILDIAKILKSQQADLKLNDGDIIWVPSSQLKTFGYRGIEAAIAVSSGILIYRNN